MSAAKKTKTQNQPADFIALAANPVLPEAPGHLDDDARKHWEDLIGIIIADDWNSSVEDYFSAYCAEWSRLKRAEEELRKTGAVVKSPSGYPIPNPYLSVARKSEELLIRLGRMIDIPFKYNSE